MCMIIFLTFQGQQVRILRRVWEWRGIGTDCPVFRSFLLQVEDL